MLGKIKEILTLPGNYIRFHYSRFPERKKRAVIGGVVFLAAGLGLLLYSCTHAELR